MSAILKSLGIDHLAIEEQISIVEDIWDNVAMRNAELLDIPESHKAELDRRIDDCETNPDHLVSWEEVKASALARLGR